MTNTEKVAFIKGMMEGMEFQPDTPEKKLINAIVDALESIAQSLKDVEEDNKYLSDYVEEVFGCYDDDDDYDDDEEDDECGDCNACDGCSDE